jgi:hypothetical protein
MEGLLVKKHEWSSFNQKASKRSWDSVYCVLNNKRFEYYKDQKQYKNVIISLSPSLFKNFF